MNMSHTARLLTAFVCMTSLSVNAQENRELKLRYDSPANYFEEALVLGNGTLGATVYGGILQNKISLNDITLWTGEPEGEPYNPEAYKALPEIRTLLNEGKYKDAELANRKIQGHYCENYQPLGTLTIDYDMAERKKRRNMNAGLISVMLRHIVGIRMEMRTSLQIILYLHRILL